jgi:hypothetical protein
MDGAENTVHLTDRAALLISPMFLASAAKIRAARGHDLASGVMARNICLFESALEQNCLSQRFLFSLFKYPYTSNPLSSVVYWGS